MKELFPAVKLCPFSLPVGGTTNETLTNFIQVKIFHLLQALILKQLHLYLIRILQEKCKIPKG
jgi:hypothetical protein